MGQTHTLAILLTILFHTLEQVEAAIEFAAIRSFWGDFPISREVFSNMLRGFVDHNPTSSVRGFHDVQIAKDRSRICSRLG